MEVHRINSDFNFENMSLANPQPVQGGSFFTKLSIKEKPFYVQLPKCNTKQGVITTKRGKYCDLLYSKLDEEILINWILSLENKCQDLIFEKSNLWFHQEIQKDDIETMLSPVFRLYKSGQKLLIRTSIDVSKETNLAKCVAYDENEVKIDLELINNENTLIPLVLIEGIRFSSKSFELDIKLTQLMILEDKPVYTDMCLIQKSNVSNNISTEIKEKCEESIEDKTDIVESNTNTEQLLSENKEEYTELAVNNEEVKKEENTELAVNNEEVKKEENIELAVDNEEVKTVQENNKEKEEQKELEENEDPLDNNMMDGIEEIQIKITDDEPIILKRPNEVYYEIYKAARKKAKHMRRIAVEAYLEAKNIKTKYALDEMDESEDDELEDDDSELNSLAEI